jgi:mono/diheme cytochrome c family protein
MRFCLLAILLLLVPAALPLADDFSPPFDLKDAAVIARGNKLFNQRCAGRCHGVDGQEGFDAPILAGKTYLTPGFVFGTLWIGRPGTAMPTWQGRLSREEIWEVTAFVSSLGDRARGE